MYTQDIVGFEKHQLLDASLGVITAELDVLPTFCPNDYFWEHHWNEGKEEKWEAYARAIQTIIANHLDLPMSDLTADDKLAYKKELKRLAKGGKPNPEFPLNEKPATCKSDDVKHPEATNKTE